jgi:hypothetical protein
MAFKSKSGDVFDRNTGVSVGYYNSSDMPWLHFGDWTITTTENCVYADMAERYYRYKWWWVAAGAWLAQATCCLLARLLL